MFDFSFPFPLCISRRCLFETPFLHFVCLKDTTPLNFPLLFFSCVRLKMFNFKLPTSLLPCVYLKEEIGRH